MRMSDVKAKSSKQRKINRERERVKERGKERLIYRRIEEKEENRVGKAERFPNRQREKLSNIHGMREGQKTGRSPNERRREM